MFLIRWSLVFGMAQALLVSGFQSIAASRQLRTAGDVIQGSSDLLVTVNADSAVLKGIFKNSSSFTVNSHIDWFEAVESADSNGFRSQLYITNYETTLVGLNSKMSVLGINSNALQGVRAFIHGALDDLSRTANAAASLDTRARLAATAIQRFTNGIDAAMEAPKGITNLKTLLSADSFRLIRGQLPPELAPAFDKAFKNVDGIISQDGELKGTRFYITAKGTNPITVMPIGFDQKDERFLAGKCLLTNLFDASFSDHWPAITNDEPVFGEDKIRTAIFQIALSPLSKVDHVSPAELEGAYQRNVSDDTADFKADEKRFNITNSIKTSIFNLQNTQNEVKAYRTAGSDKLVMSAKATGTICVLDDFRVPTTYAYRAKINLSDALLVQAWATNPLFRYFVEGRKSGSGTITFQQRGGPKPMPSPKP